MPDDEAKAHHVAPRGEDWTVKKEGGERASRVADTKEEALEEGRRFAKNQEGQVKVHGQDGRIQEERTYREDPYPPKG